MKITVACFTPALIKELLHCASSHGCAVERSVLMTDAHRLAEDVCEHLTGDVLLFESKAAFVAEELRAIDTLTRHNAHVSVVMLSADCDAATLHAAMQAGVRDVVKIPFEGDAIAASIKRMVRRVRELKGDSSELSAFLSGKAGSGASFIATNVAAALAQRRESSVALLDLDLWHGDASYYVGENAQERGDGNLVRLARQIDRVDADLLEASMTHLAPNFHLLSAPDEMGESLEVTPDAMERLLEILAHSRYDHVVLDMVWNVDPSTIKALDRSRTIYLVTDSSLLATRDAHRLLQQLRSLDYPDERLRLLINRFGRSHCLSVAQIEDTVGLPAHGVIPESWDLVARSLESGDPVVDSHPDSALARALVRVADGIAGDGPAPQSGWLSGLLQRWGRQS